MPNRVKLVNLYELFTLSRFGFKQTLNNGRFGGYKSHRCNNKWAIAQPHIFRQVLDY